MPDRHPPGDGRLAAITSVIAELGASDPGKSAPRDSPDPFPAPRREDAKAAPGVNTLLMSATNLSFAPASFDAIVCVEAAFHFDTREQFFRQAYRVLKPGGHLVLSDVLLFPSDVLSDSWVYPIPAANLVSASTYKYQLSLTGFEVATIESARKSTWESFAEYVATQGVQETNGISADIADRRKETVAFLNAWDKVMQDYILVSARKPMTTPPKTR